MKIKTKTGIEIELTAEELRHFGLDNAEDVEKFIATLEKRETVGFESKD